MADQKLKHIAIMSSDKCKAKKCRQECKKSCPVVKTGKLCIEVTPASKIAFISEELCIGCGKKEAFRNGLFLGCRCSASSTAGMSLEKEEGRAVMGCLVVAGPARDGGQRERDHPIHRLLGLAKRHCWLLTYICTLPSNTQQRSISSSSSFVGEQQHGRGGDDLLDPDVLAQTYWQLHIQDRTICT